MRPTPVGIACQGGGAHTAFTAGVLATLLEAEAAAGESHSRSFRIVGLSGTSGGAVCAALAWWELLTRAPGTAPGASKLERFWTEGYPEGNAAMPYVDAWLADLRAFVAEGRLPGLRVIDRMRADAGAAILRAEAPAALLSPVRKALSSRPYFAAEMFGLLDGLTPPPVRAAFEAWRAFAERLPADAAPAVWVRNLLSDWLALNPLDRGALLRRELDVQDAFRALLERYLTDEDLARLRARIEARGPACPELLLGAVDVLRVRPAEGDCATRSKRLLRDLTEASAAPVAPRMDPSSLTNFRVFRGTTDLDRLIDAVIASAAIPDVMRAVALDGSVFWDGLYSANPPLVELAELHDRGDAASPDRPEEIWVILINPLERDEEPRTARDIEDRRNELAGNVSMLQEMRTLRRIHQERAKRGAERPVSFHFIAMEDALSGRLDYVSKLDRRLEQTTKLIEEGKRSARAFLEEWRAR